MINMIKMNVVFKLVVTLLVCLGNVQTKGYEDKSQGVQKEFNQQSICFQDDYMIRTDWIENITNYYKKMNSLHNYIQQCQTQKDSCEKNPTNTGFKFKEMCNGVGEISAEGINKDCFGFRIDVDYFDRKGRNKNVSFLFKKSSISIKIPFGYFKDYRFIVTSLGNPKKLSEIQNTYRSKCFHEIKCNGLLNWHPSCNYNDAKDTLIGDTCIDFMGNVARSVAALNEMCSRPSKKLTLIIIGVSIVSVLLVLIIVSKICRFIKKQQKSEKKIVLNPNGISPRVMLLCRPGCKLLEEIVRDIAFILELHGIKVELSLLEQSAIDAEGGIPSYLQRNIDTCDFILILFTPKLASNPKYNQKTSFEFALSIVTGYMFRESNCAKYIALYTNSFEESVRYIPNAFHAINHPGYQIPKDLIKLTKDLVGNKNYSVNKEIDDKQNFFTERIKYLLKQFEDILYKSHVNVAFSQEHQSTSDVSNFSSYWTPDSANGTSISGSFVMESHSMDENNDLFIGVPREDISFDLELKVSLWKDKYHSDDKYDSVKDNSGEPNNSEENENSEYESYETRF